MWGLVAKEKQTKADRSSPADEKHQMELSEGEGDCTSKCTNASCVLERLVVHGQSFG